MKIGIKYCGGCNPRYDRKAVVKRLIVDLMEKVPVKTDQDLTNVDLIVKVSGCRISCAHTESSPNCPIIELSDQTDYETIFDTILSACSSLKKD